MDNKIKELFIIIQLWINQKYPTLRVQLSHDPIVGDYLISLNDTEVFHSAECCQLLFEITQKLLWENNLNNVFFIVESKQTFGKPVLASSSVKTEEYHAEDIYEVSNPSTPEIDPLFEAAA